MIKQNFFDKLLGGVKVEWKPLGEVARFRRGSFPQPYGKSEWYDGEGAMPFVQVADVGKDMLLVQDTKNKISKLAQPKSVFVQEGTVVVTLQGSIGRIAITQYDCYVDRTLAIFESFQFEINKKYFAYQLQAKFAIEKEQARGSTIKTITKEEFTKFPIPIPCPENPERSLAIQAEIVRVLDDFTELTAEITEELTAELTARKKQYTYYRDQLLTFEEGEVEWKTLGEVCSIGVGQSPNDTGIGEYPFVNAGTTPSGYLSDFNTEPDTITTPSRGQGGIGFVGYQNSHFWCGPLCYRIRSTCKSIKTRFIYYVMSNSMANIIGLANMAGVPALNRKELILFKIPIPCLTEQERIVSILDKFDALTSSITEGLPREIELRQKQYEYYRNMLLSFPKEEV